MSKIDLCGKRFGKLIVIKEKKERRWICQCDCGNVIDVHSTHLGRDTNSCGCLRRSRNKKRMKERMKGLVGRECAKWQGENIGYAGIHAWARKNKPKPEFCECCNANAPRDCANISQEYRRDLNDFEWLCRRCHMATDGRLAIYSKLDTLKGSDIHV